MNEISYTTDWSDRNVSVNDEWDCFALDNDGEAILASRVRHRSLWDFIGVDAECVEIDAAMAQLRLFERTNLPRLTHGICAVCLDKMFGSVGT